MLDLSEAAANSLLQRARADADEAARTALRVDAGTRDHRRRTRPAAPVHRASEAADATAFSALLAEDVGRPCRPSRCGGTEGAGRALNRYLEDGSEGDLRAVASAANRQPAAAFYLRKYGETEFRLIALDVLTIRDGLITEMDTFDPHRCPGFDLPEVLD